MSLKKEHEAKKLVTNAKKIHNQKVTNLMKETLEILSDPAHLGNYNNFLNVTKMLVEAKGFTFS